MNILLKNLLIGATLFPLMFGGDVLAQDVEKQEQQGVIDPAQIFADEVKSHIKELDIDKDGKLSSFEASAGAKAYFASIDDNKDGKISSPEYYYHRILKEALQIGLKEGETLLLTPERQATYEKLFKKKDSNGDGIITEYESMVLHREAFIKYDSNNDSYIDDKEFLEYIRDLSDKPEENPQSLTQ